MEKEFIMIEIVFINLLLFSRGKQQTFVLEVILGYFKVETFQ